MLWHPLGERVLVRLKIDQRPAAFSNAVAEKIPRSVVISNGPSPLTFSTGLFSQHCAPSFSACFHKAESRSKRVMLAADGRTGAERMRPSIWILALVIGAV